MEGEAVTVRLEPELVRQAVSLLHVLEPLSWLASRAARTPSNARSHST